MEYSLDVTSHEKVGAAITVLTNDINIVSTERARVEVNEVRFAQPNALPQGVLQLLG